MHFKVGSLVKLKDSYVDWYDIPHQGAVGMYLYAEVRTATYLMVKWLHGNSRVKGKEWLYPEAELEVVNENR